MDKCTLEQKTWHSSLGRTSGSPRRPEEKVNSVRTGPLVAAKVRCHPCSSHGWATWGMFLALPKLSSKGTLRKSLDLS